MGLIRGGLIFTISSLLLISLFLGNLFLTFSLSLSYNDLKSELAEGLAEVVEEKTQVTKIIEDNFETIETYCENESEFALDHGKGVIIVPCGSVNEGPEAVADDIVSDIVEESLNETFGMSDNGDLLSNIGSLFFSENSSDKWRNLFYLSLIASLALAVVIFFLTEVKINFPISLGFLIIISSLPFVVINFLLNFFDSSLLNPVSVLFSESYTVFFIMFAIGILALVFGFGFKFFKMGYHFSSKLSNFTKKSKEKKPEESKSNTTSEKKTT